MRPGGEANTRELCRRIARRSHYVVRVTTTTNNDKNSRAAQEDNEHCSTALRRISDMMHIDIETCLWSTLLNHAFDVVYERLLFAVYRHPSSATD